MQEHQGSRRVGSPTQNERGFALLIWPIIIAIAEVCAFVIERLSVGQTW